MLLHTSKHFEPRFCSRGKRELKPKVKIFCFINASISSPAKQNDAIQRHHRRASGGEAPSPWKIFFLFFEKNSHFNAIWITCRTFLKLFERKKLLSFGSQLKKLNYPVRSALYLQVKSKAHLNACILGLKFPSDLADGGGGGENPLFVPLSLNV